MTPPDISHRFGIRERVLLIALVPMVLMMMLVGGYSIMTRIDDTEQSLIERGESMARLLAASSEFGLLTGNREMLRTLSKGPMLETDVADIIYMDSQFDPLLRAGSFPLDLQRSPSSVYQQGRYWYFMQPVTMTGISFQDTPELSNDAESLQETVGWVVVVLSELPTVKRQEEILYRGLILISIVFIVAVIVALRYGRKVSQPIQELSRVVQLLQEGRLDTRSDASYAGELETLAKGINRLASRVQESNQLQESRIDTATRRLKAALYHLEQQNSALSKSRHDADEANKAKDEFLARMSHELRTPLTSVIGFANLLEQSATNPEQRNYTRIINQTSVLLQSIIDDILDFSKLQSNAIQLERIRYNLEQNILDVLEMQSKMAHDKGLELILDIAPDAPHMITGDPTRIRQVLTNLIGNAIKFTKTGSVSVNVSVNMLNQQQGFLKLLVADTGIGIPDNQLQNLFKAFSQADTSITRRFGGSGLGLVIARKLIELMGGHIELESKVNEGTQIELRLPLSSSEIASINRQRKAAGTDQSIALYDPCHEVRQATKNLLERHGTMVTCYSDLKHLAAQAARYEHLLFGFTPETTCEQQNGILEQLLEINPDLNIVVMASSRITLPELPLQVKLIHKPARPEFLLHLLHLRDSAFDSTPVPLEGKQPLQMQVVIAEDNDFNRLLIHRILRHAGIHVREARNGEEAVTLVEQIKPDAVIMDVHMPVMDGIEATRQIHSRYPDLPVIALTANVVSSEHQSLLLAGAIKVLLKPINDRALLNTLEGLKANQAASASASALTAIEPSSEFPEEIEESPAQDSQLERYQIDTSLLEHELVRQLKGMQQGFTQTDEELMRHHAHQLLGLAGLYELPELEAATAEFQEAVKLHSGARLIWQSLWRLQRIIQSEISLEEATEESKESEE